MERRNALAGEAAAFCLKMSEGSLRSLRHMLLLFRTGNP